MPRQIDVVSHDIENWIDDSTSRFERSFVDGRDDVWVLKFIDARFLGGFLKTQQLTVSATPGFTWGDAVYVTPLSSPYSTMMYGRAGVLGRIPWAQASRGRRAYDAHSAPGLALYQEWIQHSTRTFRILTTTIHANVANRLLRNAFRARFEIDVVDFAPDQLNAAYVDRFNDHWFAISDWTYSGIQLPGTPPKRTDIVKDCRWVAIVGEQFEQTPLNIQYNHLFRPYLSAASASLNPSSALVASLRQAYTSQNVIIIDP